MRKVVALCHISIDAIAAIPSGKLDWVAYDEELEKWAAGIVANTDTALYGRNTFEIMKYWKTIPDNPEASEHERNHAEWIEKVEKVVISTTMTDPDWANARIVKDNIEEEIAKLKDLPGKNITIFGSPTLTTSLIKMGLVDEYQLSVSPVVLSSGKYLFKDLEKELDLKLLSEQTLKSGALTLHYTTQS